MNDELHPVYVSRRARQLLEATPEGADDARISALLADKELATIVREALSAQAGHEHHLLTLEVGEKEPRRFRVWADAVTGQSGEVREILLLIRKSV